MAGDFSGVTALGGMASNDGESHAIFPAIMSTSSSSQQGPKDIFEDFEDGQCRDSFSECAHTDGTVINTESIGSGTSSFRIRYDHNESLDHLLQKAENFDSIEVSYWQKFPTGTPFPRTDGANAVKQARLFRHDGTKNLGLSIVLQEDQTGGTHYLTVGGPRTEDGTLIDRRFVDFELVNDRWFHSRWKAQLNTPGNADGSLQFWLDDQLVLDLDGLVFHDEGRTILPKTPEDSGPYQKTDGVWVGGNANVSAESVNRPWTTFDRLIDDVRIRFDPVDSEPVDPPTLPDGPLVEYRSEVTNRNGVPLTTIQSGDQFFVKLFAKDLRSDGQGVFSAYADLDYDSELAQVDGPIQWSPNFKDVRSGSLQTPGSIEELGGLAGDADVDALVATIPMIAIRPGTLNLATNAAEETPLHETTLQGLDLAIGLGQQRFVTTTIEIINRPPEEDADVNQDGSVSAIDALMVINFLNRSGAPEDGFINTPNTHSPHDVNGDGRVSALDALIVINRLNQQQLELDNTNRVIQSEPIGELLTQRRQSSSTQITASLQSDRDDDWPDGIDVLFADSPLF